MSGGMPAATMQGGQALANGDACKTPAGPAVVVIPYPNIAILMIGTGTTTTVLICNMPAYTVGSTIPMTNGDQAGVLGGVISSLFMGQAEFRTSSSKVKFGGQPAILLTATTGHNGANANMPAGTLIAPGQVIVIVAF